VVFFEDHAIDAMVKRKLEQPELFLISANTLNQPAQAWVHYHLGAQHPYLPELEPPPGYQPRAYDNAATYHDQKQPTWRASELPQWSGPANYTIDESSPAPFVGHRWLPLPPGSDIDDTPISVVEYNLAGSGWHSWVVGAQTHYSFFENLEKDQLHRYKYDLWDYHYDRISIHFILVTGEDILRVMPIENDDEGYLTMKATKALGRHAVMEGTGLAVHFGFGTQVMAHDWHGLHDTDALDRYRAFAEERVCGKPRGSILTG
jgi:hypothetical protein